MSDTSRRLPPLVKDIQLIGELDPRQIDQIRDLLDQPTDTIEKPESLAARVSQVADVSIAGVLVKQLLRIHSATQITGRKLSELVRETLSDIRVYYSEDGIEAATQVAERAFLTLAFCRAISRTAKAIDLSYDCDNLLQRIRILTDVRPLFDEKATSVTGAVVAHTLRLRYDSAGIDNELSLALDENDLREFIEACERALIKSDTARREICDRAGVPALTPDNIAPSDSDANKK